MADVVPAVTVTGGVLAGVFSRQVNTGLASRNNRERITSPAIAKMAMPPTAAPTAMPATSPSASWFESEVSMLACCDADTTISAGGGGEGSGDGDGDGGGDGGGDGDGGGGNGDGGGNGGDGGGDGGMFEQRAESSMPFVSVSLIVPRSASVTWTASSCSTTVRSVA